MTHNQKFDDKDEITASEKQISEKTASEFTAFLKNEQADKTKQSQDFGKRLTDYVPGSPIRNKKKLQKITKK